MGDLSDFFKLIKEEKKKKDEEFNSLLGEDFSTESFIQDIFSTVKQEVKKEKIIKEKIEKIFDDVTLESLTNPKPKSKKTKSPKPKEEESRNPEADTRTIEKYPDVSEKISEEKKSEDNLIEKSLGLLAEPSNTKVQTDSLTPINQKFATFDDLQKHYNLFLTRIQQQLSTLGGGGETNLAYMDMPLTYVTTSSYTIIPQDYYIGVNYAGRVNITLPTPRKNGKVYIVKDELGEASKGTNRHIYIYPSGTDLIDGEDYVVLAYDFGSLTFVYRDGWRVV